MANIDATAAVVGFIVNGAGVATLRALLERAELIKLREDLSDAIGTRRSEFDWVERKRKKLLFQLAGWVLLLNLINLAVCAALVTFLIVGPERLSNYLPGLQASPLTRWAKILLWLWLGISGLTYLALCLAPTARYFSLWRKAGKWLRDNKPKSRRS